MVDNNLGDIFRIPSDVIFPDELNRYLKDQNSVLFQDNATLQNQLNDLKQKYNEVQQYTLELKNRLNQDNLLPAFAASSQTVNTKIVELSKNYRDKCSELEKYKTKCSKLMIELKDKEAGVKQRDEQIYSINDNVTNQNPSETKQLQDKINCVTNKMIALKNANTQLKSELRQAKKMLQQETGEDPSSLQTDGSWKGRAEVICDLQEKNRKLKERLKNLSGNEYSGFGFVYNGRFENIGRNGQVDFAPSKRSVSTEKISSKLTSLEKEVANLKQENEAYKNKLESMKSRCNVREIEYQDLKIKIRDSKDTNAKNLELIKEMTKELNEAKQANRYIAKQKDLNITKLNAEMESLSLQLKQYKQLVEDLKVKNQERIDRDVTTIAINAASKERETQFIKQFEEEKSKLLELVSLYKNRAETERNEHYKCQQYLRTERQKLIKLETAASISEIESGITSRSGYSKDSQISANTLSNQLQLAQENIKALQTRLEMEQNERRQDYQEFAKILGATHK